MLVDRKVGQCTPSTTSRSRSTRARRSASSASRAAARRRSSRSIVRLSTPTGGTSASAARTSPTRRARELAAGAARAADGLPGSAGLAEPAQARGQIVGAPLQLRGVRGRVERARARAARPRRPEPRARQPLPARVLRRPAPAHRDRARAGHGAEPDDARRAGVGARRLDPGAGRQPARRPAGRVRALLRLRRARPVASCATSATASRSCTSARSSSSRRPRSSTTSRSIPTPPRCWARSRSPIRGRTARASATCVGGRAAEPDRPADRLPLPHALPARDGVCAGRAAADGVRAATSPPATTR